MSPSSRSVSPLRSMGPIISSAEINCELTLPAISSSPPSNCLPLMWSGGKPSLPAYLMSAPSCRSASTRILMGRCFMRSVPVSRWLPLSVAARKAVMNRMAVPAAWMSMVSGMSFSALTMTSVSSQSLRLSGSSVPPDNAQMMSARFDILFEAGSATVARSLSGLLIVFVVIYVAKIHKNPCIPKKCRFFLSLFIKIR